MRAHDGSGSGPGASEAVHRGREVRTPDAFDLIADPEQALAPELE